MPAATLDARPSRTRVWRWLLLAASFLGAQGVKLWILLGPLASQPWLQGFRNYFANDQLSYAAIATTVANGTLAPVEPLTETGVSYYPSGWYYVVGTTSLLTGAPVHALWQILGLLAVGTAIALLGLLGYSLTRNPIAPLLPALALATGTFSTLLSGDWFTYLGYHAVMWGPFGTLFTLNAESIGVVTVAVVFTWLVVTTLKKDERRRPTSTIVVAAGILGLLANVQTYSFFSGTSLAIAFLTCYALITEPSRRRLITTIIAVAIVLALGQLIANVVGPLPLFVLLILATVPAYWPLLKRHVSLTAATVVVFAVASSPQVVRTALGLVTGDTFLNYRQASSEDLGVDLGPALIAALPLIAIAATLVMAAVARPRSGQSATIIAAIIALIGGVMIMATNDQWGFNQEPYRFWLQYSIVGLLSFATLLPWAWARRGAITPSSARAVLALTVATAIVWAASLLDVVAFREYARDQGLIAVDDEFGRTLRSLVGPESGLVLSSACLDPQVLRLATGAPVAYFNRGLAWPERKDPLDRILDPGRVAVTDPAALAAAGVTYAITNSSCEGEWAYQDARVQPERIEPYPDGTLTLWRVAPATP